MLRSACYDRVKAVRTACHTALETINVFKQLATNQPDLLYENDLTLPDINDVLRQMHDAYFVRMFGCFESVLRQYWQAEVKKSKPQMQLLCNSIANRLGIPQDTLDLVHEVRDFRNFVVHEEHEIIVRHTIDTAFGHLNAYLSRFPVQWRN